MRDFLKKENFLFFCAIAVFCGVFYLPVIENHTEAEDAYWYAQDVEELSFRQLLHPNHRLYHPLAKFVFLASREERSFDVLVFLSGLLAGLALLVFSFLIKQQTSCGRWQILAWTGCLAFSYGYWRYAREVEVYATGWLVCLLALGLLLCMKGSWAKGLLFSLAVVVALNVHRALGPPLLVTGLVYFLRLGKWRVACGSLGLGLVFYLACEIGFGALALPRGAEREPSQVSQFFSENLKADNKQRQKGRSVKASSLAKGLVGLGVSLLGGNVVMASDDVFKFFDETLFPYRFMEEEKMMTNGVSALWIWVWALGVIFVLLLVGRSLVVFCLRYRQHWEVVDAEVWAVAAGFFSYGGMIIIFEPGNPEMWLLGLPLFWLMIILCSKNMTTRRTCSLSLSLVFTSYVGGMALLSNKKNDYHHVTSSLVRQVASESDLYLMGTRNSIHKRYVNYSVALEVAAVRIEDERLVKFYHLIRQEIEKGRRVFVHETLSNSNSYFTVLLNEAGLHIDNSPKDFGPQGGEELLLKNDD